ncbi:HesA/MoeB/ThiF family protein [Gluconobacter wancherniae]|uniref:HesA/MoeB/ThiF family protein n=1 Tax=Gluconobacter wancherniae TaxID=1307955 RepID=UPI001B8CD34C|nr:HesA/MoeB/ThiF family protein [Gluconobacter wancherniae]MBS1093882.1 HesA/MoeB/ThiF family protein [Gluconobacter wancherniae]
MMLDFTDHELERYSRHILLPEVGATGQGKLRSASVLVIGAGGLGAPLLQQLAASGIGRIGIIDHDVLEASNLQRQVLYDTVDIGRYKADVAAEHLRRLNPLLNIEAWTERAGQALLDRLLPGYDLICDGTDNFQTRVLISDASVKHDKTLVSGAVQGFSGQLAVFRPQRGGPCYRCLFPEAETTEAPTCGNAGVLGAATGVIGSLMAVEVMREIMELEGRDQTKLMIWDALSGTTRSFVVTRDPACTAHLPESH